MTATRRTTDDWADLLARTFAGTEYAAKPAEYWGWCAAGVGETDNPDDVLAAWREQADESHCEEIAPDFYEAADGTVIYAPEPTDDA